MIVSFIGGGTTGGAHRIQSRLIVALPPLVVGCQDLTIDLFFSAQDAASHDNDR